jgi:RNA polymerase sigma-70 factor (ECF subfamily)
MNEQTQILINRCLQGNTNAFGILVDEYQGLVYGLAFRMLCDEEDAKDMVQTVFLKAWLQLRKYDAQYKFSTWLYKITANLCVDALRSVKRFQTIDNAQIIDNLNISSSDNLETEIINRDLKDLILLLTNELTPKQKLIFTLRDIEELDIEEVEKISGLSAAKIKSNLYLARQNIKNKLNKIL